MKETLRVVKKKIYLKRSFYLFSEKIAKQLKRSLNNRFTFFNKQELTTTMHILLGEMIINAVKATHKKLYYKHFVVSSGKNIREKISYRIWLESFKKELEDNQYVNLNKLAISEKQYVSMIVRANKFGIIISVINRGSLSKIEQGRITEILEKAKEATDLSYLFEDSEVYKEGAGLGIGMIIMTLKNLKLDPDIFHITTIKGKTIATIRLPWSLFGKKLVPKP